MDILMSVPILSVLVRPSIGTSVNLLFFYATWSTLVLSHDPISIHATALLVGRIIFWLLPALVFLGFDALIPSLAKSIKFSGSVNTPRRPLRVIGLAVFNMLLVTLIESVLSFAFYRLTGKTFFRMSTTLPLPWQIFKHHCILFSSREVLQYYIHRFLLHNRERPYLTRVHEEYAHGAPTTPLQLYVDHPLPIILTQLVPVLVPCAFIRPHMITYLFFFGLITLESTFITSGYSIVPGIIVGGNASRTAAHYASKGRANFGTFGILDWGHGTNEGADVMEDIQEEASKHSIKDRANDVRESIEAAANTSTKRSSRRKSPRNA